MLEIIKNIKSKTGFPNTLYHDFFDHSNLLYKVVPHLLNKITVFTKKIIFILHYTCLHLLHNCLHVLFSLPFIPTVLELLIKKSSYRIAETW